MKHISTLFVLLLAASFSEEASSYKTKRKLIQKHETGKTVSYFFTTTPKDLLTSTKDGETIQVSSPTAAAKKLAAFQVSRNPKYKCWALQEAEQIIYKNTQKPAKPKKKDSGKLSALERAVKQLNKAKKKSKKKR